MADYMTKYKAVQKRKRIKQEISPQTPSPSNNLRGVDWGTVFSRHRREAACKKPKTEVQEDFSESIMKWEQIQLDAERECERSESSESSPFRVDLPLRVPVPDDEGYQISTYGSDPLELPKPWSPGPVYELASETVTAMSIYLESTSVDIAGDAKTTPLPAFSPDMLTDIDREEYERLKEAMPGQVFFTLDNCDFTTADVQTLLKDHWLNDNIINGYMKLLQLRDAEKEKGPSCHFCKTFLTTYLYPSYNYKNVRRWTLPKRLKNWGQVKESILDCDLIFFPVNRGGVHWILVVADLRKKELTYYDSMCATEV